jgi:hypothetical protein
MHVLPIKLLVVGSQRREAKELWRGIEAGSQGRAEEPYALLAADRCC